MRSTPNETMRYNVVDSRGVVSFVAPGHVGKMLAAAASASCSTVSELLASVHPLDGRLFDEVRRGLLTFDEFVVGADAVDLNAWRTRVGEIDLQPFRVANDELRNMSLRPAPLGLTIFNLVDRRIIQIEDRYGPIGRSDRGRLRVDGRPVARYYEYTLPDDWAILP